MSTRTYQDSTVGTVTVRFLSSGMGTKDFEVKTSTGKCRIAHTIGSHQRWCSNSTYDTGLTLERAQDHVSQYIRDDYNEYLTWHRDYFCPTHAVPYKPLPMKFIEH